MQTEQQTLESALEEAEPLPPREEPASEAADLPITVIRHRPGWHLIDFGELWRFRELLYFLAWRDVKVRYKQAVLGALWAILQPLAMMIVFTLFFRKVGHVDDKPGDLPYSLFLFSGLLPWMFFANVINSSSQSVVAGQNLIRKVYFPRLLIPLGTAGAGLCDLAVAFVLLLVMMLWNGIVPSWSMLLVPLLVLGLVTAALGLGTFLAALIVAYRDFRYVVPFGVQLWMFSTPTIFMQTDQLNSRWQALLPLNPAYGLIANFRAAALDRPLDWYSLTVSASVALVLLVGGSFYFRRMERSFADIV